MKALCSIGVLCSLALTTTCFAGDGITWEKDLDAAKSAAKRSNRLILIHFSATWCEPCKQIEREVFSVPGFGKELTPNFVAVKLDYDHFPATAHQYGVQSLPCDVILAPNGQVLDRMNSPLTATEYVATMQRVATYARTGQRPLPPQTAVAAPTNPAPQNPAPATPPPQPASAVPLNLAGPAGQPAATNTAQNDNSYMNYYNQQRAGNQPAPGAQPYLASNTPPAAAPQATAQTDWLAAQPPGAQTTQVSRKAPEPTRGIPQIPPGNPPLALEGNCPVTLVERGGWGLGDPRYGMQHRGRTYLFVGPQELERFRANPDRYSPVLSGNDPVLQMDQHQTVPGNALYGLFCRGRIYLFASEETLHRFQENQNRYAVDELQARR